jgi:hypothetical protein
MPDLGVVTTAFSHGSIALVITAEADRDTTHNGLE